MRGREGYNSEMILTATPAPMHVIRKTFCPHRVERIMYRIVHTAIRCLTFSFLIIIVIGRQLLVTDSPPGEVRDSGPLDKSKSRGVTC